MFHRLGSFAVRFRWFIIAAWVIVALVLTLVAPNINSVAVTDQRSFLQSSAPSLTAHTIMVKYFPDRVSPSSAIIVVDAGSGKQVDQGQPATYVEDLPTRTRDVLLLREGRVVASGPLATALTAASAAVSFSGCLPPAVGLR